MKLYQHQFIEFAINKQALRFGQFKLKSGRISPYFFNIGLFNTGYDLSLLSRFYASAVINSKIAFNLLFGPAYKGIPIVTITAMGLSEYHKLNVPYCFNRKEIKLHGEGGNIIGSPLTGRIMLVDDVITAGTAIHKSMKIIQDSGATLSGVLIALNRQEKGLTNIQAIQEIENKYGCKVISIITLDDLISYLKKQSKMYRNLSEILTYREEFCT